MKSDILFMPLGGGQRIGASCYLLRLGNNDIILDAGSGNTNGTRFTPVFSGLSCLPSFYSMSQISSIFISHAHMDHIGALLDVMSMSKNAGVYMTDITRTLTELQLYDKVYFPKKCSGEYRRLSVQSLLEQRISSVSYMKPMEFTDYKVTFYPAGHIPGAMMTLFEYKDRSILYTGDYSVSPSPLTPGCVLPSDKKIDTLILCGLHAKHPFYRKNTEDIYRVIDHLLYTVSFHKRSAAANISQLSKGAEFLRLLNERNITGVPVFVDSDIMQVVRKLENKGFRFLNENVRQMTDELPHYPHIYLTMGKKRMPGFYSENINADFTLHEDYREMKQLIKQMAPRLAVIVHCAPSFDPSDIDIEQDLLMDSDCNTQIIFAEEQQIYSL